MDYYYPFFEDLSKVEKQDLIVKIIEEAIIPNMPAGSIEWMDVVANGYKQAKKYVKAIEWAEKALALAVIPSQRYSLRFNLVSLYISANWPEKALRYAETNLKYDPNDWEMIVNRAVALFSINKKLEAREIFINIVKENKLPEKAIQSARFNLGLHYITAGDFKGGMKLLQIGREMKIWGANTHKFPIPRWDGVPRPGKSVLIVGEGGIGDEFINARFCKHFRDMGMIPHVASCHKNASVFSRMPFESVRNYKKFTTDIADIKKFDYWAPMMDLPQDLGVDFKDLWYGNYVTVDKEYDRKWKEILPRSNKIKIGLKWSGNPLYEQELHRTVPITKFVSLFNTEEYELVSLQKEHAHDLDDNPNVLHINEKLEDIEDLVAAINNLDVVITSCTSIAHVAGALGKQVYVCVPIMNYYIWAEPGYKSSWYGDHVTLLRQTKPRDWSDAVKQLKGYIDDGSFVPKRDF